MPLITRRSFAKTAAAALPFLLSRNGSDAAVPASPEEPVGTLPSGVPHVPVTPFKAPAGAWSIVSIPDSQHDAAFYPEVYQRQMEWIAAHKETHQIQIVVHEGDVTEDNGPRQWARVRQSMDALKKARVPYSITTGNHDFELVSGKVVNRLTRLNDFFNESDYAHSPASGVYQAGRVENSWHEFENNWGRVLVLSLEFGAPHEVLQWARDTIAGRKPARTVLTTHAYLHQDGSRYDFDAKGESQPATPRGFSIPGISDGEIIWRELVSKEDTIRLVLCGHTIGNGAAYLASRNDAGHVCHQVMANYQMQVRPARGHGSGGFLLLAQFQPNRKTVQLKTYSPWYNVWLHGPAQDFTINLS